MNVELFFRASGAQWLKFTKLRDESGNTYWGIDEDLRDRLRSKLMRAVLSFKV